MLNQSLFISEDLYRLNSGQTSQYIEIELDKRRCHLLVSLTIFFFIPPIVTFYQFITRLSASSLSHLQLFLVVNTFSLRPKKTRAHHLVSGKIAELEIYKPPFHRLILLMEIFYLNSNIIYTRINKLFKINIERHFSIKNK